MLELRQLVTDDISFIGHTLQQTMGWGPKKIIKAVKFMCVNKPVGLVLTSGNEPVGFMLYKEDKKTGANVIKLIVVIPAHRRKGGALAMLECPIKEYLKQGVTIPFEARISEDNLPAQMLFRKAGFKFRGYSDEKLIFRYSFVDEAVRKKQQL
jgi:RimJ/RimL family protein N-acetyltransferase